MTSPGEASPLVVFWFEAKAELLLVAMRDTMEVGEVVSEELEEFEADELLLELEALLDVRMVDEVTEVGGVPVDNRALDWASWALN